MSAYDIESRVLREVYEGFCSKVTDTNCSFDKNLGNFLNDMKALVELLETQNVTLNILDVIATFSLTLSMAEYTYSGNFVQPDGLYDLLIDIIYNKNLEE